MWKDCKEKIRDSVGKNTGILFIALFCPQICFQLLYKVPLQHTRLTMQLSTKYVRLYSCVTRSIMLQRKSYSLDSISDSFKMETTYFTEIMLLLCRLIGLHIWNILNQFCYFQDAGLFCRSTTEKDIFTHRRANLIKNQPWIQNSAITFTARLLNWLCKFEKLAKYFPQLFGPSAFCGGKQRRKMLFKYLPYLQHFTRWLFL